jgi:RNA recognition motif-containing protein
MMTRLFVFNLPWTADSDALMAYLTDENFSVESVQVIKDKTTGQSKGYAFVEFTNDISAKAAFQAFQDGKLHLGGRRLGANEAHPKAEHQKAESPKGEGAKSSPKPSSGPQKSERASHDEKPSRGRRGRRPEYAWDEQD